jgi:hypothetical protein
LAGLTGPYKVSRPWWQTGYEMTDETKRATKYRERAKEVRLAAQTMTDAQNIKAALSIADNYEFLAKSLEAQTTAEADGVKHPPLSDPISN